MVDISRRGFLIGMLAAAGAATAGVSIAAVPNKYENVVRMHDEIVMLWQRKLEPGVHDEINTRADALFNYLLDNFATPTAEDLKEGSTAHLEMRRMFGYEGRETAAEYAQRFRDVPPTLMETVIPVAVSLSLIKQNRVRIDPSLIDGWKRFAATYRALIVAV